MDYLVLLLLCGGGEMLDIAGVGWKREEARGAEFVTDQQAALKSWKKSSGLKRPGHSFCFPARMSLEVYLPKELWNLALVRGR